ncbi:CHD3-type chromatin-remodeling factor PICKLE [Magnolia sinica]|uniref:CHD3-type chromatin-remodeling factor PICKLE n=1 Tax=Magnolia sinica TaxID=86752 RepID=UPI00265A59CF|nr:CHD3-type chromatin-remodeling factor PICKLE [Magnolia sinica]
MSSLVERLRNRPDRKLYHEDESDDELFLVDGGRFPETKPEKITRPDAKDGACQSCGESGDLLCCETCNYSYHSKCLLPPLKVASRGIWSCPECVSPLSDIDKILDCEMRPTGADESEASKLGSKQKFVKQYLVKWKGLSYLHCTWVPEKEFLKAFKTHPRLRTKVNNFHRQMDSMNNSEDDWVAIRPEWTTVDRILATRRTEDEREYLVKWKELPYDECYWEVESDISAFQPQIERFNKIQSKAHKSITKNKISFRDPKELKFKQKEFQQFEHSPGFLSGGSLHPYQLEGLNFLRFAWSKNTHVILADEMGLGKTIQSIAFVASLFEDNITPHLVVAPLSTLRNWEREFATWAPQMNVVLYVGTAQARSVIKEYEFFLPVNKLKKHKKKKGLSHVKESKQKRIKFDVLLTSYEMINMDTASLKSIRWQSMIVDEGHRLKNKDSKLFLSLKDYATRHRVLLTGTPLQNNLDELFMLMHFLDAGKFSSLEEFQEEFKDINQEEQILRLHKMLAPHLLRRVKKDVMKDLPPKKELILRVELSSLQKEYYKAILTRNYQLLARRGGAQISLINVVMELRKLCCHAYMLEGVEPEIEDHNEAFKHLLDSSGKLHLLDKMMVRLREQGHRVLIYTQFQHMLDLLEDYLSYKKWSYERIDGKVSGVERQIRIDRFNAKNSTRFCFLLSTRAGGLGINLATADTVIIYDSDWNPHADLQAMARAHRLGQTNKVMIFRLITRGTIEERMMQLTKKKMILEHLVVGRLKNEMLKQEELDDIIRYGSKELFADEGDEAGKARQIHYDDAAIDRLLDRDQIENEEASVDEEEDDSFLKAFKVANFEYIDEVTAEEARKSKENKPNAANSDRANYWDDLLKDRYEVNQVEELSSLGKRKRSQKHIASAEDDDLAGLEDVSSDDEEDGNEADWFDTEKKAHASKKKSRGEANPLMEGEGKSFKVLGFNQNQRAAFVQILMRYGLGDFDWSEFVPRMKQKSLEEIKEYGILFLSHIAEDITNSPSFSDGVPKEGLRIQDVLVRVAILHLMRDKVKFLSAKPGTTPFAEDILSRFPGLRSGRHWKEAHDISLLNAVLKHGYGRWQAIVEDKDLGFQDIIRQEQKLNLPTLNGSVTGGSQMPDGNDSGSVPDAAAQGATDTAKGNQLYQDASMLYHMREVQRRIVEYIKKRVLLLEKAINAEYQKEVYSHLKASEPARKEPASEPKVLDVPSPNSEADFQMYDPLPPLEAIAPEEVSAAACDNKPDRLDIARLYNEMCKLIDGNIQDSVKAYVGSKSAGSRLRKNLRPLESIYGDIHKILAVQQQTFSTVEELNTNASQSVPPEVSSDAAGASVPSSYRGGGDPKPGVDADSAPKDPKTVSDMRDAETPPAPSIQSDKENSKEPRQVQGESACSPKGSADVEMMDVEQPADVEMTEAAVGDAEVVQNPADVIVLDD